MADSAQLTRSTSKESLISAFSHVGDWEIGDRCQIGGRLGNVVYIGLVRFAPGEWIGIVLDQPLGKNDGSIDGHRYFSCEPNHGLFCKASKLERVQSPSPSAGITQNNPFCKEYGMEIGDRVIVSGGKLGTLRFLGNTEFKDGVWAGIELDQPVGKNDGSVQGKRYFACKAPYGLFAVASKVVRAPEQGPAKLKIRHTKTSALRQRSGSHESLSSFGGGASSIASSRISKFNFATPRSVQRPIVISSARGQEDLFKTLQDSLKEKETHLEQMIRERDIERNEMAALSSRCEQAEAKASQLENAKNVAEQQIEALKVKLQETKAKFKVADSAIDELTVQLKEKKEAFEDLTFRYDEESILNAELREKIDELEKGNHMKEKENAESSKPMARDAEMMNKQLETFRKQCSDFEQERLSLCALTKDILSAYRQDFVELIRLVSSDSADGDMGENTVHEAVPDNLDPSAEELKTILDKLNDLVKYHKAGKKAVQERLEKNNKEIENLAAQRDNLKRSVDDSAIIVSQQNEELKAYRTLEEQLRRQLEEAEIERAKVKEMYDALEVTKNALKENLDFLNKRNSEMIDEMEKEKQKYGAETAKLTELLQKLQNDFAQSQEQHKKAECENSRLFESYELVENRNKKLLADVESLEAQKLDLENKRRQKESEMEASLARNEAELCRAKLKIDELIRQVDRLCEASSNDENLKKEMESLREEGKKETAALAARATQLQTVNESLEKELSASKNNLQTLESACNALKHTLDRKQTEHHELNEKLLSLQRELAAEQEKSAKLQQEIACRTEAHGQLQRLKDEEAAIILRLQTEKADMQQRLNDMEAEKKNITKEKDELQKEHVKIKERYDALTQSLKSRVGLANDYEEKMKKLAVRLLNIEKDLSAVECKGESLEETIGNLLGERSRMIDSEKETKEEIEKLLAEKEKLTSDLTATVGKLSELADERAALTASLNSLKNELLKVNKSVISEQANETSLISEIAALKEVAANVGKSRDEATIALNNLAREKRELEQHITRLQKERNDKDAELNMLKAEVSRASRNENNDDVVSTVQAENGAVIEEYRKEIEMLKEESSQAYSQINSLKFEILELSKRQAEDQVAVSEAKQRNALFLDFEEEWKKKEANYMHTIEELKKAVGKTETEKIDEMKRDISFLNSIIAEQYKKEKDLKDQIAILNSAPANETLAELQRKLAGHGEVPSRKYCDICEEFDLHDTEDCPTQAMDMLEDARHTHNSERPPPRDYCEHCEEFGHGTDICAKMQAPKSNTKDYTF